MYAIRRNEPVSFFSSGREIKGLFLGNETQLAKIKIVSSPDPAFTSGAIVSVPQAEIVIAESFPANPNGSSQTVGYF
jgi:hypothetical protein